MAPCGRKILWAFGLAYRNRPCGQGRRRAVDLVRKLIRCFAGHDRSGEAMKSEEILRTIKRMEEQWGSRANYKVRLFLNDGTNVLAFIDKMDGELLHVYTHDREATIAAGHVVMIQRVAPPRPY